MDEVTAAYHAHPAWSATRLKAATSGTMRDYWHQWERPDREPLEPSDPMRQGSLVDCLLLLPDLFNRRYSVAPAGLDRRTKAGKAAWEELQAEGREIISADWHANALAVVEALRSTPDVAAILDALIPESQTPGFWEDPILGSCRYLPDIETSGWDLWDLKKTCSANPRQAAAQAHQLAYDVQLDHYAAGFEARHGRPPVAVGLICWEWEPPHNVSVLRTTPEFLEQGRRRRLEAFERISACRASGEWPSYGSASLDVPPWMRSGARTPNTIDPDSIALF